MQHPTVVVATHRWTAGWECAGRMLKDHWQGLRRILISIDLVSGPLALLLVAWLSGSPAPGLGEGALEWLALSAMSCVAWPLSLAALGMYESQRRRSLVGFFARQLFAMTVTALSFHSASSLLGGPLAPHLAFVAGAAQGVVGVIVW